MRRILMVLSVAALLVAMVAYTVTPAFSAPRCDNGQQSVKTGPGTFECQTVTPGKNKNFSQTTTTPLHGSQQSGPTTTTCNRPGNTDQCPPGQFQG